MDDQIKESTQSRAQAVAIMTKLTGHIHIGDQFFWSPSNMEWELSLREARYVGGN